MFDDDNIAILKQVLYAFLICGFIYILFVVYSAYEFGKNSVQPITVSGLDGNIITITCPSLSSFVSALYTLPNSEPVDVLNEFLSDYNDTNIIYTVDATKYNQPLGGWLSVTYKCG